MLSNLYNGYIKSKGGRNEKATRRNWNRDYRDRKHRMRNQAVITCEGHNAKGNGIIHLDGIAQGETVTIKWASPVIGQSDMTKTLYCLNGSPRVGATSY